MNPYKIIYIFFGTLRFAMRKFYEAYYKRYLQDHSIISDINTMQIVGRPYISIGEGAKVSIGSHFICRSGAGAAIDNSSCSKLIISPNASLVIGDYTGISNTVIECQSSITIGNSVNIGAGTMIIDTDYHSTNWRDRAMRKSDIINRKISPIRIGDYVFIGARSIICKGVYIGEKSIVAAGSVVVKNIPPGELWGGNPAKFIKKIQ